MIPILGLDPGTKHTGWALSQHETGTIEATTVKTMAFKVVKHVKEAQPEFVAMESFQHEAWRGRRIATEAKMGELIGRISAGLDQLGFAHELFPAGVTKTNMEMLLKSFPNSHEFSAFCVLNYAHGWLRIERAAGRIVVCGQEMEGQ